MRVGQRIVVIIPALNEEASIATVLNDIPDWVDECIVVNNGSEDATAAVARDSGARVVDEPKRGYGRACMQGINAAQAADIIVFLDADYSDDPADMHRLVDPLIRGHADLCLGERTTIAENRTALSFPQYYGNRLACLLIRLLWRHEFHDLGPFRAIRSSALTALSMVDTDYGWTVEMQVRAIKAGRNIIEVPVSYQRRRAGRSKVSGTVSGVVKAGSKILYVIFREALSGSR